MQSLFRPESIQCNPSTVQLFLKASDFFICTKFDAGHVDVQRSLNPPSFRIRHASPILKRARDESIRRNSGNRFVPILYFNRIQRNL